MLTDEFGIEWMINYDLPRRGGRKKEERDEMNYSRQSLAWRNRSNGPPHETHGNRNKLQEKIWAGRILSASTALFMPFDGVMKIVKPVPVLEANVRLAYPVSSLTGIGTVLIACTVIYIIRRTSIWGAILLTGYLGGAVASNVRAGSGWFETVFPAVFATLVWGGLWLRDRRLRSLLAFHG